MQTLCLERKRAERSRKPFVLMLASHEASLDRTASAVCSVIRETDIAGWYRDHATLGVLFVELGVADTQLAVEALRAKVQLVLQARLSPEELKCVRLSFHVFPEDGQATASGSRATVALYPDLAQRDEARQVSRMVKRAIDILGSTVALIALAPVFCAIATAIKLSSPGPVLFRQRRLGRYGMPFTFLKFRSMACGNDPRIHMEYVNRFIAGTVDSAASEGRDGVVYKITDDPRVTRVGRFIRRTSLDELPQLFNVLRGQMSLVGPRPPMPYEFQAYDVWHRRRVLEVKPGITGLWQVKGRSRLRFDDMVRLDLQYAQSWSPWLDLKILLLTPRAVLSRDGAY